MRSTKLNGRWESSLKFEVRLLIWFESKSSSNKRHVDQIYGAMPLRLTRPEGTSQDNELSPKIGVKSESVSSSTSPESTGESEEFEMAMDTSGSSEAEPSPKPAITPSRQYPRRTRKPPERLEYQ